MSNLKKTLFSGCLFLLIPVMTIIHRGVDRDALYGFPCLNKGESVAVVSCGEGQKITKRLKWVVSAACDDLNDILYIMVLLLWIPKKLRPIAYGLITYNILCLADLFATYSQLSTAYMLAGWSMVMLIILVVIRSVSEEFN